MVNHMETVAAKLPKTLLAQVNRLIEGGTFPNRSEVIRVAVRQFLEANARRSASTENDRVEEAGRERLRKVLRKLAEDPRYLNRFVALHRERVIDSDDELDPLVQRVLRREEQPIFVERVNPGGAPARVRLPGIRVRFQ
jgi:Arc/MetJ-type ribon-helix-helix transcriptional regulator